MPTETISFLGAGRYSDVFKVTNGRQCVVMKLSYYRDTTLKDFASRLKKGDSDGAANAKNKDSIMVSSTFSKETNNLIRSLVSPHFVYMYYTSDIRNLAHRLAPLIPDRIQSSTPTELKYNNASFIEPFTCDMTKWMRSSSSMVTDDTVRAAIFGVLYTLAALQRLYPGFRHNDLSTNNVLVKRLRRPLPLGYVFDGTRYYIPDTPVLVAINDYDFVHVPGHPTFSNERIMNGKYRVSDTDNPTYDTHFFIKSVLKNVLTKRKQQLPETRSFLLSLPLQREDRLDKTPIDGMEPKTLLRHPFFDAFRRRRIPRAATVYSVPT